MQKKYILAFLGIILTLSLLLSACSLKATHASITVKNNKIVEADCTDANGKYTTKYKLPANSAVRFLIDEGQNNTGSVRFYLVDRSAGEVEIFDNSIYALKTSSIKLTLRIVFEDFTGTFNLDYLEIDIEKS